MTTEVAYHSKICDFSLLLPFQTVVCDCSTIVDRRFPGD